ncbi:hypothetical protein PsAD26_00559 [Pseudovibrio sp. Ad26]|nr:hypothetical protein PsAD26_00559 [Pseudovibrio sp. Ad26]
MASEIETSQFTPHLSCQFQYTFVSMTKPMRRGRTLFNNEPLLAFVLSLSNHGHIYISTQSHFKQTNPLAFHKIGSLLINRAKVLTFNGNSDSTTWGSYPLNQILSSTVGLF